MDLFTLLCFGTIVALLLCLPRVAMDVLSVRLATTLTVTAQKNITGSDYSPITNGTTINKLIAMGTTAANAVAGGGDEFYSAISSIGPSSSVTVSLAAFTDFLNQASALLTRVKLLMLRLLSATDDATLGTAASSVTVDGTVASAFLSAAGSGWLTNATSKIDCPNGGILLFGTPSAAGVLTAGASAIKLTNNDGALTAKAQLSVAGGST
jgi:hypothetical protein